MKKVTYSKNYLKNRVILDDVQILVINLENEVWHIDTKNAKKDDTRSRTGIWKLKNWKK